MEKMNDLRMLLQHELEDLRSAEDQIIAALPKMIEKAKNAQLSKGLADHLKITKTHVSRLEQVQEMLKNKEDEGEEKKGFLSGIFGGDKTHCKGMEGLISEGEKTMKEDMAPEVLDAAIIACAQKVEHYEICAYGTLRAYARELNLSKVAELLEQTLNEEYDADDLLTRLALGRINEKAEAGERRNSNRPSSSSKSNGRSSGSAKKSAANRTENKKSAPKKAAKKSTPKKAVSKKSAPKKAAKKSAGNTSSKRSNGMVNGNKGRKQVKKTAKKRN
ncbi:MAG: hypothetical protein JWN76_3770 [Chitinophagaceae bacterium]|nr:hypothetical protein [Chitinophagaceae bacterium]